MSVKENWKEFISRVENRARKSAGVPIKFKEMLLEILSDGDCLPGPIVAKRGNVYVCESTKEPQTSEDFTVCVLV